MSAAIEGTRLALRRAAHKYHVRHSAEAAEELYAAALAYAAADLAERATAALTPPVKLVKSTATTK